MKETSETFYAILKEIPLTKNQYFAIAQAANEWQQASYSQGINDGYEIATGKKRTTSPDIIGATTLS